MIQNDVENPVLVKSMEEEKVSEGEARVRALLTSLDTDVPRFTLVGSDYICKVTSVIDGHTLDVVLPLPISCGCSQLRTFRIRLKDIDTPSIKPRRVPGVSESFRTLCRGAGRRIRAFLKKELVGKLGTVRITGVGIANSFLGIVTMDGRDTSLNEYLLEQGLARKHTARNNWTWKTLRLCHSAVTEKLEPEYYDEKEMHDDGEGGDIVRQKRGKGNKGRGRRGRGGGRMAPVDDRWPPKDPELVRKMEAEMEALPPHSFGGAPTEVVLDDSDA